jgi:cytoskeleton protein RodZ
VNTAVNTQGVHDVQIARNGRLAAVVAILAGILAVAFLVRHHGVVDLVLGVVLLALAGAQAWTAWDARTPLLVADDLGVRVRLGRVWQGIPWAELDEVEHLPRGSWWRDGRLVLLPEDDEAQLAALPAPARRHAALAQRLYGAPFAVPLGLTTVVAGGSADLSSRLADLAGDETTIVEIDPGTSDELDAADEQSSAPGPMPDWTPEPTVAVERDALTDTAERPAASAPAAAPETAPAPAPSPLREPVTAVRSDLTRDYSTMGANALKLDTSETDDGTTSGLPEAHELRRPLFGGVDGAGGVTPIASAGEPVEPLVIDDLGPTPAAEPVIGPELAAARTRIGLSVDQLADRTRIRPHVIEAIEVDDFGPCGGDFYARGHLRTLARVLGVDAAPLLAVYDETYADAPIDPRRVFESELATSAGGPLRRMKGGPNWSVLVAAVMAIVLAWSIARLVLDHSSTTAPPAPSLGTSSNPYGKVAKAVPVTVSAAGGGADVVVRDGSGDVVFSGSLAFGQSKKLQVSPPIRIQSSDGSTTVSVDGGKATAVGETGAAAQQTYTAN